jgi:hypothetical protein
MATTQRTEKVIGALPKLHTIDRMVNTAPGTGVDVPLKTRLSCSLGAWMPGAAQRGVKEWFERGGRESRSGGFGCARRVGTGPQVARISCGEPRG